MKAFRCFNWWRNAFDLFTIYEKTKMHPICKKKEGIILDGLSAQLNIIYVFFFLQNYLSVWTSDRNECRWAATISRAKWIKHTEHFIIQQSYPLYKCCLVLYIKVSPLMRLHSEITPNFNGNDFVWLQRPYRQTGENRIKNKTERIIVDAHDFVRTSVELEPYWNIGCLLSKYTFRPWTFMLCRGHEKQRQQQ